MPHESSESYPLKSLSQGYQNRLARLIAVQTLYANEMGGNGVLPENFIIKPYRYEYNHDLTKQIVTHLEDHKDHIDSVLQALLPKSMHNFDVLLISCLRLASYEILYAHIQKGIVIKDYLTILDSFFDNKPQKIFHSVIDKIKLDDH